MKNVMPSNKTETSSGGTIYLLRHGAVQSPSGGKRYIGWQNLALNRIGLEQAAAWAAYFEALGLDAIWCSDLIRCRETAGIIGRRCSLQPRALPELREVCLGEWEGKFFEEMKNRHPQAFQARGEQVADHRPPGGESFRDLQNRTWPVFEALVRRPGNRTLMVTHAGVIRVLLCRILGMPIENLFSIGQSHGALSTIDVRPEGYRIQGVNLSAAAAIA